MYKLIEFLSSMSRACVAENIHVCTVYIHQIHSLVYRSMVAGRFSHSWEECKQLMLGPNFFESLKFFDKDGMSRHKLRQLRSMLRSPQWRVDTLQHASRSVYQQRRLLNLWY